MRVSFLRALRTCSIFQTSSTVVLNCQIKAHQAEHVKATEGVLKDLLATQDQEVLHLLKEAAEQEKGKFYPVHGTYPSSDLFLHSPEMGMGMYYIVSYSQNFPPPKIVTLVAMPPPLSHSNDLIIFPFQEGPKLTPWLHWQLSTLPNYHLLKT